MLSKQGRGTPSHEYGVLVTPDSSFPPRRPPGSERRKINPCGEPLVISRCGGEANLLARIEALTQGGLHKDAASDDIVQTVLTMFEDAAPYR